MHDQHPIQLVEVMIKELSLQSTMPPKLRKNVLIEDFDIRTGLGPYDEENKTIAVGLRIDIPRGKEEKEPPFQLTIELIGLFLVNIEEFPKNKIEAWAQNNAPLLLLPYMREHIYSLTQRAGFAPVIIPLYTIPQFIEQKPLDE